MGKFTRSRAENDEPLSAGRVEYLEQARQRARNKRIRRTAVLLVLLTGIVLFATGLVGSSVAMAVPSSLMTIPRRTSSVLCVSTARAPAANTTISVWA